MPLVSVIVPTYNRAALLAEAVASVRDQSFGDWELVVADDGSSDDTAGAVAHFDDARIRLLALPHTGSAARARNAGVAATRGPWIAFLDSDDRWHPTKLAAQVAALTAHPERQWSSTGVQHIDVGGQPVDQRSMSQNRVESGWVLEPLLTFSTATTMSSLIVARTLFERIGGFDEQFESASREDYDLALRLAAASELHALEEPLTLIREHPARSTSGTRASELHRYNDLAFTKARHAATDARVRAIAARQSAAQRVQRARALTREGESIAAVRALGGALRAAPMAGAIWRATASAAVAMLLRRGAR